MARWLRRRRAGFRWRLEMVRNRMFDIRYGVETHIVTGLAQQGVSAAEAVLGNNIYRPIWSSEFRDFLRVIGVDPRRFTFVDFGSGKGKMLFLAALCGFAKIIGVEYAPGLYARAIDNIRIFKENFECTVDISQVHADARAFELPQDPLVIIMFNPFGAEIARAVVEHIEDDYRRNPREMYLLYANRRDVAEIGDAFAGMKIFEPLKASRRHLLFHAGPAGKHAPG